MSKPEYAVEVKNVKKSFYLPNHKNNSLKQAITQVFKKKEKGGDSFDALKDISFNVEKGDFFGVLGRNGSGKSTLLKIISDIYQPSSGSVKHNGKLVAFIELGVGFKAELSGRDNVYLNGALLGFSKKEIEAMYDEIVEFAELEMFMDQKLKNYSSGMKVRLAFSVAIRAKADILILDEVLAVGDASFQKKCYDYFKELKDAHKTIIFVSHSMGLVKQYCNKAVLIEDGKITHSGLAEEVADEYTKLFKSVEKEQLIPVNAVDASTELPSISASILGKTDYINSENLQVIVNYRNTDNREVYPKVVLYYEGRAIMGANGKVLYGISTSDTEEHTINYVLPLKNFNQAEANVVAILVDSVEEKSLVHYGYGHELSFSIKNPRTGDKIGGIICDPGHMELADD